MKKVFRYSSLAVSILAGIGLSNASMHAASFGTYSTAVPEDRLFIENGTTLRCDLFFASAGDNLVAPKGSRVSQTVPPFVWQYSGLLPVSDYLKTVAIHSTSSEEKVRSWQDVQQTFYSGLRAEGAEEQNAKVAFAGAYAFAPRWPLVEFIDITDPERDKDSKLFRVEYIAATPKGVSIDEYRTLVQDIMGNSDAVSLSDIRGVIDAADAAKAEGGDNDTWLQQVWRNEAPQDAKSVKAAEEITAAEDDGGNNLGKLFLSEKKRMEAEKAEMEKAAMEETAIVSEEAQAMTKAMDETEVEPSVEIDTIETDMVAEPVSVAGQLAEADKQVMQEEDGVIVTAETESVEIEGEVVDLDTILIGDQVPEQALVDDGEMKPAETKAQQDWTVMPDGSQVLEIIE
jgi:hypothetical protein